MWKGADPLTMLLAPAMLLVAGAAAAYLPARRAQLGNSLEVLHDVPPNQKCVLASRILSIRLAVFLSLSSVLFAQTAKLHGVVTDESGAVVPGASPIPTL
jgi:hypothetical protein